MKLYISLTKLAVAIFFFTSVFLGLPGVSEAFGVYIGTEYHISESVSMLFLGLGLIWIAGLERKNLIKK